MLFNTLALTSLLALTSAAPVEKRFPSAYNLVKPSNIAQYSINTGAIKHLSTGLVQKNNKWDEERSTLVTFNIPASAAGRTTCSLHFWLDPQDSTVSVDGTGLIDLFESNQPAPEYDVPAWGPPGNQRGKELARFKVVKNGEATFSSDVPNLATNFKCPPAGKYGVELVGAGDRDIIKWGKELSGAYLTY